MSTRNEECFNLPTATRKLDDKTTSQINMSTFNTNAHVLPDSHMATRL